jgi:ubiquinone biosynthesis accessory factor UbiK
MILLERRCNKVRIVRSAPNERTTIGRDCRQYKRYSHQIGANSRKSERIIMSKSDFLSDFQAKINQVLESSPAKGIEKNMKAMLNQGFSKLDLVTREEFEIQTQVLAKTRSKLEALEARVAELEAQLKK